jgi:hypothetical protein
MTARRAGMVDFRIAYCMTILPNDVYDVKSDIPARRHAALIVVAGVFAGHDVAE